MRRPAPAGAEHPEAPRNHAPQREKRGAEGKRQSEATERAGRPGPGPRSQEAPGAIAGGRRKAQSGPEAARGEPPLVANK